MPMAVLAVSARTGNCKQTTKSPELFTGSKTLIVFRLGVRKIPGLHQHVQTCCQQNRLSGSCSSTSYCYCSSTVTIILHLHLGEACFNCYLHFSTCYNFLRKTLQPDHKNVSVNKNRKRCLRRDPSAVRQVLGCSDRAIIGELQDKPTPGSHACSYRPRIRRSQGCCC